MKIKSNNNKLKSVIYNSKKFIYDNCVVTFIDSFQGEEIYLFNFKLNNKTVLKFNDTI